MIMPSKKTTKKKAARKSTRKRSASRKSTAPPPPSGVEDLKSNPANPRKEWSAQQRKKFKESLIAFGDLSGIVYNRTTGQLVGGHKRIAEFRDKFDAAEIDITDTYENPKDDGTVRFGWVTVEGMRFAYREVQWDKAKESAANVAANQWGSEMFDNDLLGEMLQEIRDAEFDLELTGFDSNTFNELMGGVDDGGGGEAATPPGEFPTHGSDIETKHTCPSCGYKWS